MRGAKDNLADVCAAVRSCRECGLAKTRQHALCGEGPRRARLMLVAQAPGQREDAEGRMFIGPSGRVLDELLGQAGVDRKRVYMTNLVKCFLPRYRRPKQEEIRACSRHLEREIACVAPEFLVPLGYFATRWTLEHHGLDIPPKAEFKHLFGRLQLMGMQKVLPLRHPSALLHTSVFREEMIGNYRKLGCLQSVCKWYPVCPVRVYFEAGRLDRSWIELYCRGDWGSCTRYQLEERGIEHPDWMLPDGSLDTSLQVGS